MNSNTGRLVSEAAKKETDAWNRILELRINLQKPVELANRLPCMPMDTEDAAGKNLAEGTQTMKEVVGESLENFIGLLETQTQGGSKKRKRSSTEALPGVDEQWARIQSISASLKPKWIRTIDKWHARVHFGSEGSKKKLSVFDKSIFQSVDQALDDGNRVVEKSRSLFRDSRRFGREAEVEEEGGDVPQHDLEVYDDRAFYSVLLKTFISNSTGSAGGDSMRKEDLEELRKYRQARANVDRKASKGRKVRYVVHPKVLNFMFPVPCAIPEGDVDRLFASLFKVNR